MIAQIIRANIISLKESVYCSGVEERELPPKSGLRELSYSCHRTELIFSNRGWLMLIMMKILMIMVILIIVMVVMVMVITVHAHLIQNTNTRGVVFDI